VVSRALPRHDAGAEPKSRGSTATVCSCVRCVPVQIFLVPPTRSPTQTAELPGKVVITSELHTANSRTTDPSPAEESSSQYLLVSSPKLSFIDE
jgi:hypothetical protein